MEDLNIDTIKKKIVLCSKNMEDGRLLVCNIKPSCIYYFDDAGCIKSVMMYELRGEDAK